MSKKQYRELLNDVALSLQARRIAAELYESGRSRSKTRRTRIARKTAREIQGWAEVNQRIARHGPRSSTSAPFSQMMESEVRQDRIPKVIVKVNQPFVANLETGNA